MGVIKDATIKNTLSLNEYNNNLRVAVTEGEFTYDPPSINTRKNRVIVLKEEGDKLNQIGTSPYFAEKLAIDKVNFYDSKAYINVDNLLNIVDLSEAINPKLIMNSKLSISDISDPYIQPIDDKYIIAMHIDKTKKSNLSIFDISDPTQPIEISKYTFANNEYNISDFTWDVSKKLLAVSVEVRIDDYKTNSLVRIFDINIAKGNDAILVNGNIEVSKPITTNIKTGCYFNYTSAQKTIFLADSILSFSSSAIIFSKISDLKLTFLNTVLFPEKKCITHPDYYEP